MSESKPRLRLLKVIVQPVFAVDDGESLVEQPAEPIVVSPAEWPTYASTKFVKAMEDLQAELDKSALGGSGRDLVEEPDEAQGDDERNRDP